MATNTQSLRFLSQAVQQVNTVMEIPAIMRCVVASAMQLTNASGGAGGLMTEGRVVFTEYNQQGRIAPVHYEFTSGCGVPGRVIATRIPYVSNDAANDPHVDADIRKALGIQTLAAVPVISCRGDLLGCFEIHNKASGPFDDNDLDHLMVLAAAAAGAIENAQMLLDRTAVMEALHKSVREVSESRNMLRLVMDAIPVRVFWKDTESRYLGCNSLFARDAGRRSPEELVGKTDFDMAWREQADLYLADDQKVISSGQAKVNYVEAQTTSDGRVIWLQTSKIPLRDTRGTIIGVFGSYEDITERKRMEESLREGETRFRTLVEHAKDAVFVQTDWRFAYLNPAALRLFGASAPEQLLNEPVLEHVHPDFRELIAGRISKINTDRQPVPTLEYVYLRLDGTSVPVEVSAAPIEYGGRPGAVVFVRDIAERKRAQEALRESEERLRATFDNAALGIVEVDSQDRFIAANDRVCRILGYQREELLGMTVHDLTFPEDRAPSDEINARLLEGHIDTFDCEKRYLKQDGSPLWVHITVSAIRDSAGRFSRGIATVENIAERKRAEDQLKELNATLEQRVAERTAEVERRAAQLQRLAAQLTRVEQQERQQLATLLHDNLQQLLVGAKFRLSVLRNQPLQEKYLQSLRQAEELLDASLKTSRSLTAELSPPILHEGTLAQVLHWLARWAKEKYGLTVPVLADEEADLQVPEMRILIFQAVRELLLNVAKHAGVDRAGLTLSRRGPDRVQILVSDEGVGFDRAEKATEAAGNESGAGLGLFSIRERMELMGGSMEIDSQPGGGTRIGLTAPCSPPKGMVPAGAPAGHFLAGGYTAGQAVQRSPQDQSIIHVLLADDHEVVRTGLTRLLQMESDIEVVGQAADGQEAVEIALKIQPDVILMDVSMPRMSGVEATRRIMQQLPSTKIIGLSMHEQEDVAASMKAAGATTYLTKTSPPEALIAAIRECTAPTAIVE